MTTQTIDIAQLDCIYLSYDEPQKEEFWTRIQDMIPWSKRVDGVHGSDAAHKAAAEASETERFILIDGDNMPDIEFFDKSLTITPENQNAQFRWRARNNINGLYYGNGGMSSWTKSFVANMRTHENTEGQADTNIEFCFDPLYWPMHDCYSTTYINYTPKQAWRAGFREGVKMCTRSGEPPTKENFSTWVWPSNMKNLNTWQTIGRDIENGWWAIHGARLGTHYLMLRNWDHTAVRDFTELDKLWELHKNDTDEDCVKVGLELKKYLDVLIAEFDAEQSAFVKYAYGRDWRNTGIMNRETFA